MKCKIALIDYSTINSIIGDYSGLPHKIFVNKKYAGLVKNSKGSYALVSENYELTHPMIEDYDIEDFESDIEIEYEVLFDIENNNNKKYKYTILLDSLLDSEKIELDSSEFFINEQSPHLEGFINWINE